MKMSVKEYAQLIGKNEKTVYKMTKDEVIVTHKIVLMRLRLNESD